MLEITHGSEGEIRLAGRFDASQTRCADEVLSRVDRSATLDLAQLEYISSAGLGVLLSVQKGLAERGAALKLVHLRSHIRDVFRISGFDQLFEIE